MSIYVQHDGKQLGPFTEAELKAQLTAGAVSLEDYVWWDGQKDWVPLNQTPYGGSVAPGAPLIPGVPAAAAYPTGAPAPTSKLAIWALVCGCLSLFLSLLASIPAIIFGHLGLSQIKKNPGMQGHGMALAGLIMGYVFTFLLPIISIIAISVLIALGNQVKSVFTTIDSQMAEQVTNSADQTANPPDQSTPAPATTTTPDQSTNSAPATPSSPDSSATNSAPATNAAPMSQ